MNRNRISASELKLWQVGIIAGLSLFSRSVVAQNPIAETINASGMSIELIDIAQLPLSRIQGGSGGIANTNILVHAGDANRVFVNDMRGQIYIIENDILQVEPFLDLSTNDNVHLRTYNVWQGFTTFAFHPDFAKEGAAGYGKLYTATDEDPVGVPDAESSRDQVSQHSVLAEWTVDAKNPNRVDPASRRELLRLAWPSIGHKMDQIAFNPNVSPSDSDYGMLYVSLGDGGNTWGSQQQVDADRNGQNTENLFGTIARIDPLGTNSHNGQYGIPSDNPFIDQDNFEPETWAYGFRNPHRFSWDRQDLGGDGAMYISDIGQALIEEVNIGISGGNYGWSEREGTFVVDHNDQNDVRAASPEDNLQTNYIDPVIQYDHSEGRAIVGGYVVRGPNVLDEHYVFGDIRNGRVFAVDTNDLSSSKPVATDKIDELLFSHSGATKTLFELVRETDPTATRVDLRFGQGPSGELYVLSKQDGYVRKMNLLVGSSPVTFDFNADSRVDISDVDLLVGQIVAGNSDSEFDLDGNGGVDKSDLDEWLSGAAERNGFEAAYLIGDANLDGVVNAIDLNRLGRNWNRSVSAWSSGDFTADGSVGPPDLNALALRWQDTIPAAANPVAIPEPPALPLTICGIVVAMAYVRAARMAAHGVETI